jgi:hypothetical protein
MAGEEDFVFENSPGTDGGAPVDSFKTACKPRDGVLHTESLL